MTERPQARSTGVLTEWVGDELVVYDSAARSAHCLSANAAAVWALCDGQRSPADIAGELGMAAETVDSALRELGDTALLENAPPAPKGISRRDAAKRLATLGAAAVSAPLIYSVAIPAAAAAMSGTAGPPDLCAGKVCNNNNACTIDECDARTGNCVNRGIVCDDDNPCTIDSCDPERGCIFTPVTCPPATEECMISLCDPTGPGCVMRPAPQGSACNGGNCNGNGVCVTI
jgi:hypothetical protein